MSIAEQKCPLLKKNYYTVKLRLFSALFKTPIQLKKMQQLRNLSLFVLLLMATLGLQAQNGNAVISEVKIYDMGDGTGILTVRVSGNLAAQYTAGVFSISGDRIAGGTAGGGIGASTRFPVESPAPGSGNGNSNGNQAVVLAGTVALLPGSGNHADFATVDLRVRRRNMETTGEITGTRTVPFYTVTVE